MLVEVRDDTLVLNVNHISSVEDLTSFGLPVTHKNCDPIERIKVKMSNGDVYDLPASDWTDIIAMSDAIDLNSVNLHLGKIKDALNSVACCLPDL